MGKRLATGLAGAAVVVGAVWLGAPWLTLLALLGGGLAAAETGRLAPPGVVRPPALLCVIAAAALLLTAQMAAAADYPLASGIALAVWGFAAVLWFIARHTGGRPGATFLLLLLAPVYAGFLLGHGLQLRELAGEAENLGRAWLLFTLLSVFACDTGAFAVGRMLGRRPMAPRPQPQQDLGGRRRGVRRRRRRRAARRGGFRPGRPAVAASGGRGGHRDRGATGRSGGVGPETRRPSQGFW